MLYWVTHQSRYPSSPGDDIPDGNAYDSMEALVAGQDPPPGRPHEQQPRESLTGSGPTDSAFVTLKGSSVLPLYITRRDHAG
jgi:hypothetical protein